MRVHVDVRFIDLRNIYIHVAIAYRREQQSQPQNIMYDKRVVRGSNYSHMHMQPVSGRYFNSNNKKTNKHTH